MISMKDMRCSHVYDNDDAVDELLHIMTVSNTKYSSKVKLVIRLDVPLTLSRNFRGITIFRYLLSELCTDVLSLARATMIGRLHTWVYFLVLI